jgi:hypothetical protein
MALSAYVKKSIDMATVPSLRPTPSLCEFDVILRKAADGSLGVNVKPCIEHGPTKITNFKSVQDGVPGPAERCGLLRDGDLIAGMSGKETLGLPFDDVCGLIRTSPPDDVRMRVLRPVPLARYVVRPGAGVGLQHSLRDDAFAFSYCAGSYAPAVSGCCSRRRRVDRHVPPCPDRDAPRGGLSVYQ